MMRASLAIALSLLLAAPAHASPGKQTRVVLAPIRYEGDISPAFRERVERHIVDGLERSSHEIVVSEGTERASGEYTVVLALHVESRNYRIALELLDSAGKSVAVSETMCELCGIGEVEEMIANQAASMNDKLDSVIATSPVLTIESHPAGAAIALDGRDVGSTPLQLRLSAGRHHTRARMQGYFDQHFDLDAITGMRQSVSFQLVRVPHEASREPRWRTRARPWGIAVLSVGVAALGAGVALIAIDERPYRRECDGPDKDGQGDCRLRYDTLSAGVALTTSGAVSSIVGSVLLALAHRKHRPRRGRSRPVGRRR